MGGVKASLLNYTMEVTIYNSEELAVDGLVIRYWLKDTNTTGVKALRLDTVGTPIEKCCVYDDCTEYYDLTEEMDAAILEELNEYYYDLRVI